MLNKFAFNGGIKLEQTFLQSMYSADQVGFVWRRKFSAFSHETKTWIFYSVSRTRKFQFFLPKIPLRKKMLQTLSPNNLVPITFPKPCLNFTNSNRLSSSNHFFSFQFSSNSTNSTLKIIFACFSPSSFHQNQVKFSLLLFSLQLQGFFRNWSRPFQGELPFPWSWLYLCFFSTASGALVVVVGGVSDICMW